MTDTSSQRKERSSAEIFDQIAGSYDRLNLLLSGGVDRLWRNSLLQSLPKGDQLEVLDLACGTADVPLTLCRSPRVKKVVGVDLSEEMLKVGRQKVATKGLGGKITLQKGDGVTLEEIADDQFDLVTISFGIRNFSSVEESLKSIHRVLKPGGRLLIMEFSLPKSRLVRGPYLYYFRNILPRVGNLLSGHHDAYTYLNKTVESFPYGEAFLQLMSSAGFTQLVATPKSFGISTLYQGQASKNG